MLRVCKLDALISKLSSERLKKMKDGAEYVQKLKKTQELH